MKLLDDLLCPRCEGDVQLGLATHTVDLGPMVVAVRNVPARICTRCGEEWLDDGAVRELERIVEDARASKAQVTIVDYGEGSSAAGEAAPTAGPRPDNSRA